MNAKASTAAVKMAVSAAATWLADCGDDSYRNPVLHSDYSDPDAIRVGEDYWMTSSSFCHVPGLPILHSRDLINWTLVNHALPRLVPTDHFATPRHGAGVWAPSIRHRFGKFWIFYPDPDFGLYAITATDPRGKWSDPVLVKAGKGLIDPCPFWDADGTGYLIHGWAKSRAGIKNRLTLHRLRADSLGVVDAGRVIIDGDQMPGWNTIEGPKLYRRGNYYYIFAPAGGVTDGYQAVFRSRNLYGPYENRVVLARGASAVNGPHQGAWVDTPQGTDWFLHFQEIPAYGRVVHLQPVVWKDDWPVMGDDPDGDGTGEPVSGARAPHGSSSQPTAPETSDEFESRALGLQWQWQANPRDAWFSLVARPGFLRLHGELQKPGETFWSTPHLLMQKFSAPSFVATTALEFSPRGEGDTAGLMVFGHSYAWIGLRWKDGKLRVLHCRCDDAHQGGKEVEVAGVIANSGKILLRTAVFADARCQFSFSTDGTVFRELGEPFQARSSYWVGAKVGLFCNSGDEDATAACCADYDWFRITPFLT